MVHEYKYQVPQFCVQVLITRCDLCRKMQSYIQVIHTAILNSETLRYIFTNISFYAVWLHPMESVTKAHGNL